MFRRGEEDVERRCVLGRGGGGGRCVLGGGRRREVCFRRGVEGGRCVLGGGGGEGREGGVF